MINVIEQLNYIHHGSTVTINTNFILFQRNALVFYLLQVKQIKKGYHVQHRFKYQNKNAIIRLCLLQKNTAVSLPVKTIIKFSKTKHNPLQQFNRNK